MKQNNSKGDKNSHDKIGIGKGNARTAGVVINNGPKNPDKKKKRKEKRN